MVVTVALLVVCTSAAWSFGPQEALAYQSPEYTAAQAKLAAERAQVRALNLGYPAQ